MLYEVITNFRDEMDMDFLSNQLSTESFEVLNTLIDPSAIINTGRTAEQSRLLEDFSLAQDFNSFENTYSGLQELTNANDDLISQNP